MNKMILKCFFHLIHLLQRNPGSKKMGKFYFTVNLGYTQISSSLNNCSFCFLNHDYTEEDEKDEFKVFLFILFIFFSVIMVQKQNEQIGTHIFNVYFLNQAF
jgi:hypothetical protein